MKLPASLLLVWAIILNLAPVLAAAEIRNAQLSRTNLLEFIDEGGRRRPVESTRDWEKRRRLITEAMQQVMGGLPGQEKACALDPQIEEEVDCGTYLRRFLTYASEPGCRVPAYLLIPKQAFSEPRKCPGILCLHQTHALGQKVVVGLGRSPNDEYGVELVERGYVCLVPAYPLLANYQPDLKSLGYQSGTMKAIWDNKRGLDLLETMDFVQRGSFGAIGHSLGGHNAVYTAVFDPRLKVVVSSCGLDAYRDYMGGRIQGWTSARYMPKLAEYSLGSLPFDFDEIVGALAPRTCFLSAPKDDSNFKWWSVDEIVRHARPIYHLFDAEAHLRVEHPECGHLFPKAMREMAYRLFDEQLRPERR